MSKIFLKEVILKLFILLKTIPRKFALINSIQNKMTHRKKHYARKRTENTIFE